MTSFGLTSKAQPKAQTLLLLLLCVSGAVGQQGGAIQHPYRVAGRVVSAADGHALAGATISLSQVRGGDLIGTVTAGEGGTFAFEDLAPGKYSLFGQRRGFIQAAYNEHEQFSTAIVTGAGLDTETLVLRLEPASSIGGQVLDEFGEPVRNAQVSLYTESYETGKKQIKASTATATDTFGDYSFGQLALGTYFVTVKATPWYAVAPSPRNPQSPFPNGVDPKLDVAYPLTFYGDAAKEEAATPIALKAGKRFRADIHLSPVRAVRIRLSFSNGVSAGMVSSLRTPVFDGVEDIPILAQTTPTGENEVVGLAPGRYEVQTTEQSTEQTPESRSRSSEVDLTQGSVEIDPQRAVAEGSIALNIVQADGEKLPPQSFVMLRGTGQVTNNRQIIGPDGTSSFQGVPPDDYHFLVYSGNHLLQTLSIEEGEKRLGQDHRQLAAGESVTLKLVVAGTVKAVEGIAVREGKPVAGAMVVLVPVDAIDNPDLYRRDQSDQDGTFALLEVPAGRYIVIAIDDGWKLEWGKVSVLSRYLAKGMAVAIRASQVEDFHLSGPVSVQDR